MTLLVPQNILAAYMDGDATATETLRALCDEYDELDSAYRDFEKLRESVRARISVVLEKLGGKATVRGFGALAITEPSVVAGYDSKALDALINSIADEQPQLAALIVGCRKRTMRSGGLRIERECAARG